MNIYPALHPLSSCCFDPTGISEAALATAVAGSIGTTSAVAVGGAATAGVAAGVAASATAATAASTMMALTTAATVASGAVSAFGAYQQGQAQKNMMNYQAQAAAVQQQVARNTANANITGIQDQASREATMLSRQQMAVKGAQAAAMGAQGIGGSVTGADIAKDTFTKQQMDQSMLQYNANVKTWSTLNNMNNQLWGLGAQEGQYSLGAQNAETAGNISAGSSLLSSASQVGINQMRFGQSGYTPSIY